jgi:hypothetical protein
VGDEEQGGAGGAGVEEEVEDLRLNGDVEGGGGFVGHDEVGFGEEGHGDHGALAHAAGEFVGPGAEAFFDGDEADAGEPAAGGGFGFGAGHAVEEAGFDELVADAVEGG